MFELGHRHVVGRLGMRVIGHYGHRGLLNSGARSLTFDFLTKGSAMLGKIAELCILGSGCGNELSGNAVVDNGDRFTSGTVARIPLL